MLKTCNINEENLNKFFDDYGIDGDKWLIKHRKMVLESDEESSFEITFYNKEGEKIEVKFKLDVVDIQVTKL